MTQAAGRAAAPKVSRWGAKWYSGDFLTGNRICSLAVVLFYDAFVASHTSDGRCPCEGWLRRGHPRAQCAGVAQGGGCGKNVRLASYEHPTTAECVYQVCFSTLVWLSSWAECTRFLAAPGPVSEVIRSLHRRCCSVGAVLFGPSATGLAVHRTRRYAYFSRFSRCAWELEDSPGHVSRTSQWHVRTLGTLPLKSSVLLLSVPYGLRFAF